MLTAAELLSMRDVQELAQSGTAHIQRATLTSDGMGGYTEAWSAIGTVSARWGVRRSEGQEPVSGDQLISSNNWTISVPFDATVQAKDRIVQVGSSKVYEVTFVPNGQSYQTAIYLQAIMLNEETT